jgi:hypothetical protein
MLKSKSRYAAAGTAIAVATSTTAVLLLGGGSAFAGESRTTTAVAPANTVTGTSVVDGSLYQRDFNQDVINKVFRVPGFQSVTAWSIKPGTITEDNLSAGLKAKVNAVGTGKQGPAGADGKSAYDIAKAGGYIGSAAEWIASLKGDTGIPGPAGDPATDAFGKQGGSMVIEPTAIATIGGSWLTGKTTLKSFTLPAGTWLINSAVTFDRKDASDPDYATPTTDTMPQFALRFNTDANQFGEDAGTIMGNPVSKMGYVELTGSSTKAITLTDTTTITAYGFGYNEDRSGFGGGQITVGGTVSAVKIG